MLYYAMTMLYYGTLCKEQFLNSVFFWLSLISPMDNNDQMDLVDLLEGNKVGYPYYS